MPLDQQQLQQAFFSNLMAGMVPPDVPEDVMPEVESKIQEMATALTNSVMQAITPLIDSNENRLNDVESLVGAGGQAGGALQELMGDFGSLTTDVENNTGTLADLGSQVASLAAQGAGGGGGAPGP